MDDKDRTSSSSKSKTTKAVVAVLVIAVIAVLSFIFMTSIRDRIAEAVVAPVMEIR